MRALACIAIALLLAPWLAPHDPVRSLALPWQSPGSEFWLGTDALGRDVLSRLLHGGGVLVVFSVISTSLACLLGISGGLLLVALPDRGRVFVSLFDSVLVLPPLLVMIVTIYAIGPGMMAVLMGSILLNAPFTARYIRALADPMFDHSYVEIARAAGDPWWLLLWREVLPGLVPAICADAGSRLVGAIYLFSVVSFLGIASPGRGSDWASMVRDGLTGLALNPWAALLPALCISTLVVTINISADRWRSS